MSRIRANPEAFSMPKKRPEKKKDYLAWLHTLPSCISGRHGVEAAHTSTANPFYGHHGRGRGTKAPDIYALPLTPEEHRDSHCANELHWWENRGVNPWLLALTLWAIYSMYDEYEATERATARIMQGLPI